MTTAEIKGTCGTQEPDLIVLTRQTVRACLTKLDPVRIIEHVLRQHAAGRTVLPAEAYLPWTNSSGAYSRCVAMPGALVGDGASVYGLKVINAAVSNPSVGLERAGGITMLFDPETARPRVLAEAGLLSAVRTAAYTMVTLRHLGPARFDAVTLLGCGALARAHVELLSRYFPAVRTVHVYDVDSARAHEFASWAEQGGHRVVVAPRAPAAVAASPVLVTLTTADEGYVEAGWLRPGSFVAHVSLDDLREDVFYAAEAIFVDDIDLVRENPRRVLGRLMVEGSITPPGDARGRSLAGTMPDVLTGRCSPVRPCHGTVVSNPFGMSVLDIGLLAAVVEVAERAGPPSLLRLI
jgi:ornithine cyclodeaminase/alanine dehydrogenase-like protein (mu-crystallin family)